MEVAPSAFAEGRTERRVLVARRSYPLGTRPLQWQGRVYRADRCSRVDRRGLEEGLHVVVEVVRVDLPRLGMLVPPLPERSARHRWVESAGERRATAVGAGVNVLERAIRVGARARPDFCAAREALGQDAVLAEAGDFEQGRWGFRAGEGGENGRVSRLEVLGAVLSAPHRRWREREVHARDVRCFGPVH